jgi:hypothetical protein
LAIKRGGSRQCYIWRAIAASNALGGLPRFATASLEQAGGDHDYCHEQAEGGAAMIRKLQSGEYRLYSRKVNPKTGKRRNLGTFKSREAAEKHERAVQYFKRH